MTEEALWQLAELLLPLQTEMHEMRGMVGGMRESIEAAQGELHRLHGEVLCTQKQCEPDGLREELRRARREVQGLRNELRCIRALTVRQKYSMVRIAEQLERALR